MAGDLTYKGAAGPVIAEVLRVKQANGDVLTERIVVDAAADPASPLHGFFTWDDQAAAEGFRLVQARALINRVKIHITEGETVRVVPAFVSVIDEDGRRVRIGSERALADPDLLGQVLSETRLQLRGLRNRLSAFTDAKHLVAQIDSVLEGLPPA